MKKTIDKMKLIFIVGSLSDSHIIRRAQCLKEKGYGVEIYGFRRGISTHNNFDGILVHELGEIEDQHYLKRLRTERKAVLGTIARFPKDTLFYVWGFDLALFTFLKGRKYVYEISDIRHGEFIWPLNLFFKKLDLSIISKSKGTLLTSEGFSEYLGTTNNNKVILMPNQLSEVYKDMERPKPRKPIDRIKFGFVGYYRYPNTVLRLAKLIGDNPDRFEFHFWGTGPKPMLDAINKLCNENTNIFEHGAFQNPMDLPKIYNEIDIVACNYDAQGVNERIAEPNKLYESIYFNKPIVVSSGTFLGKKVERMGCGYAIDSYNEDHIKSFLDALTADALYVKSQRANSIPLTEIIEDYTQLIEIIKS